MRATVPTMNGIHCVQKKRVKGEMLLKMSANHLLKQTNTDLKQLQG
jgi:hypothetical protein